MKYISIFYCIILLSGCSKFLAPPKHHINGIIIKNISSNDISDVTIKVEKIHGVFICSLILSNSYCSNTFRNRPYQKNAISIQWTDQYKSHQVSDIVIPSPTDNTNAPFTAVITLNLNGQYATSFQPSQ